MLSLQSIAHELGGVVRGDPDVSVTNIAVLDDAHDNQISFYISDRYSQQLKSTKAAAVLLAEKDAELCPVNCVVVDNPELSYIKLVHLFYPKQDLMPGIHPTAVVSSTAKVDPSAQIGPYCVIGDGVFVGARSQVKAHCVLEKDCKIGDDVILHSHVTLYSNVTCGNRVIIHSSSVIASDGFGNVFSQGRWSKIPHVGGVLIEDDVEIGASTTIDRGRVKDTVIRRGVKLDNQIHVAHNVIIGENTVAAANVGIAGSTQIGRQCMIGGMVGIADNLCISDGVVLLAASSIGASVEKPGVYSNSINRPIPYFKWNRIASAVLNLLTLRKTIKKVEEQLHD